MLTTYLDIDGNDLISATGVYSTEISSSDSVPISTPAASSRLDGRSGKTNRRCDVLASTAKISISFQNVNRMRSKTCDLYEAVHKSDFDVIVLFETSLTKTFNDEEILDLRYFVFQQDWSCWSSSKGSGGGVLIAFDVEEIKTESDGNLEHLSV
jgi:hypothetical protein